MNEHRDREGVDPGPVQEQVDQPNQNIQNDQPDPLESFYQLTDDTKAAIRALPQETRDAAITALTDARVAQENEFQKRLVGQQDELSRGRQAIDERDAITNDPKFQAWVMNEYGNQPNSQPNPQNNTSNLAGKYGEQAAEFYGDIKNMMEQTVAPIAEQVGTLRSGFAQTQQDANWAALETYTKDNGLPDPNNYKSQISMLQQRNGLTIDQAYRASVDLSTLAMRTPVNTPVNVPVEEPNTQNNPNTPAGNEPPSGSRGSATPNFRTEPEEDPVEAAMARRKESGAPNLKKNWDAAMEVAKKNYNDAHPGANLTMDNLE